MACGCLAPLSVELEMLEQSPVFQLVTSKITTKLEALIESKMDAHTAAITKVVVGLMSSNVA